MKRTRCHATLDQNSTSDSGYALVAFVAVLVPLIGIAGAAMATTGSRSDRLRSEIHDEKALLACEAGFDAAIYGLNTKTLTHGSTLESALPGGASFSLAIENLSLDGLDNNGDGNIDEIGEDVFQVVVRGRYGWGQRRIAAYCAQKTILPKFESALALQGVSTDLVLVGTTLLDGRDHELDGSLGDASADVPGVSIASPATTAHLETIVTGSETGKVIGAGGTPSLGESSAIDVSALVTALLPLVDNPLTSSNYSNYIYGDSAMGTSKVSYRDGDVKFAGNSQGAGVLIVTGDLEMNGNSRFDGLILVLGELKLTGSGPRIYGTALMGPASAGVRLVGGSEIVYSQDAVEIAQRATGANRVTSTGWQELSRN